MSHRNLTILLVVCAFCLLCFFRSEHDPYARYVLDGYEKIDRLAYDDVPDRELFQGAMRGMVDVLRERGDQHSMFISERQAKLFHDEINQEIGGIGVRLRFEGDPPVLQVAAPPLLGKPADRAGIQQGDVILAIDGVTTVGLTSSDFGEVLERMRGKPSQALSLTVLHPGAVEPVQLQLVREKLTLDSVRGDRILADQSWQYQLDEDSRIALVRVVSFGSKSVSELETVLPRLESTGVEALILDLRNNPGGPLEAAVETCELFLPAGKLIVETRDRRGQSREIAISRRDSAYLEVPLAVLINRDSASASEIVAACLQDHGRAVVIGERSFGKGTVQELMRMQAGDSLLKLTRASFWRPSGRNIHRQGDDRTAAMDDPQWGVSPDAGFDVSLTDEAFIELAKARAKRDITAYDPQAPEPVGDLLYEDQAVDVAVAYLQEQLGN